MAKTYTVFDFQRDYPDSDACLAKLMDLRIGLRAECPRCERETRFHRVRKRRSYACQWCGYQVFPCVGTIFEGSRTPLVKWFYAIYLFASSRHGVPAKELERQLGVTYKCAWRMAHKIREFMADMDAGMLFGEVEIDESYIGGHRPGTPGRGAGGKTIVLGMKQRGGAMKAFVIPDAKAATIQPLIDQSVESGSTIHTDEWWGYRLLTWRGYEHRKVRHGAGEYARDGIHTNSIENFWARLKLSIRGSHIHVSRQWLHNYVSEFAFRYNHRKVADQMFARMIGAMAA